jgi:hypothetical protein
VFHVDPMPTVVCFTNPGLFSLITFTLSEPTPGTYTRTLPNGTPLAMPTPWAYAHTGAVWKIMKSGGGSVTTTPPPTGITSSANNTANRTSTTGSTTTSPIGVPGVP